MSKWNQYTTKEIKPTGWLKRQLQIQAEGLSGHLDQVWPDVRDSGWFGGNWNDWERGPYWLDGFVPMAYLLEDEEMIARAKRYIDAIIAKQKPDGWICPCADDARENYDTWTIYLVTKVLIQYYNCSADERIPNVIYRILKNYYEQLVFGKIRLFCWSKFRWFECFIAINFTYQRYPEDWLLDLAKILKEQGADYNKLTERWKRPLNEWEWDTHIVNMSLMLKSEAVSHELLGKPYVDEAEKFRTILDQYNGTPVGLFTGDECLSGRSPIQGTELCAAVDMMYSYELLYAHTGDPKWAERLEVVAFNALPATISDDMWTHQYDQMSNQIACQKFPGKSLFRTNNSEAHLFGLEPHYGCCTANFSQGWPKLAYSTFMYQGDTVINVVPIPSELKTEDVHILLETNYPFEKSFRYAVSGKKDFTFKIRVPGFAQNLRVNGEAVPECGELTFAVKAGEDQVIDVSFDTVPYMEKRSYDLYAVKCGSLVFSVPIAYDKVMFEYVRNGVERKFPYCDYEYIPLSDWNYAYSDTSLYVEKRNVSDVPFSSQEPPVVIKAKVKKIDWGLEDGYMTVCAKVPESREPISEEQEILLYPYGCAKLRMTEIPLLSE